jgi:hypothetical protein
MLKRDVSTSAAQIGLHHPTNSFVHDWWLVPPAVVGVIQIVLWLLEGARFVYYYLKAKRRVSHAVPPPFEESPVLPQLEPRYVIQVEERLPKGPQREMALPTSSFHQVDGSNGTTTATGIVAFKRFDGSVMGMGSRVKISKGDSALALSLHQWSEIVESPNGFYLEHKGKAYPFIAKEWNIFMKMPSSDMVLVRPQHDSVWSVLQVGKLRVGNSTAGYCKMYGYYKGDFVYTVGNYTHNAEDRVYIDHFCSSVPGFSGTPLLVENTVIGFHLGAVAQSNHNYGVYPWFLILLSPKKTESDVNFMKHLTLVEELPDVGAYRRHKAFSDAYEYDLEIRGSSARVVSAVPRRGGSEHFTVEDDLYDIFEQEADFPLETPEAAPSPNTFHTFSPLAIVNGLKGKERAPGVLPIPAIPASNGTRTSSPLPSQPTRRRRKKSGPISKALDSRPPEEMRREPHSSSKPTECKVLVVLMTRKQEKFYNKLIQVREYRKHLESLTDRDYPIFRRNLLRLICSQCSPSLPQVLASLTACLPRGTETYSSPMGDSL